MARVTTLTTKGQVTIPKEIRDEFGLRPNDKIEFSIVNGYITLRKARFTLAEMQGMLPPIGIPVEEMTAIAWEEWAKEFAEKSA